MTKKIENYSLAVEKLEEIVEKIEQNSYDIDELTDKVKEAVELISFCKNKLKTTDAELEKIFEEL